MAGTNRMLEGLKRNGESRGVVMNFLATQGLKNHVQQGKKTSCISKNYFFFVEVVFFLVEVVFFFVVVLFVTVGAGL